MALPSASPLTPTVRYYEPGVRKFYWVGTIASKAAPTSVELSAGTDLTAEVSAAAGFTLTTSSIAAPDYGTRFEAQVTGKITAAASSLTFYATNTSADVRTLLTRDLTGFIVIFPEGIVTANKMDVWPVRVSAVSKPNDETNAASIMVEFVVTSIPVLDITIPVA